MLLKKICFREVPRPKVTYPIFIRSREINRVNSAAIQWQLIYNLISAVFAAAEWRHYHRRRRQSGLNYIFLAFSCALVRVRVHFASDLSRSNANMRVMRRSSERANALAITRPLLLAVVPPNLTIYYRRRTSSRVHIQRLMEPRMRPRSSSRGLR